MKIGSLFSGYGGLDMAAEQFFGAGTVWTSDIDPGACQIIAHRMPDQPNLGDITAVDWDRVEPVDLVTAGWPCQPFSLAGKRKGAEDDRALWPHVARAVRALRPRHVLLENVAAIATAGELARATADLAALGYLGSWRCLRAADVGAPHGRARIFILATRTDPADGHLGMDGGPLRLRSIAPADQRHLPNGNGQGIRRDSATDTERGGRDGRAGQLGQGWRAEPENGGSAAADTRGEGLALGRVQSDRDERATLERDRSEPAADTDGEGQPSLGRLDTIRRDPDRRSGENGAGAEGEPEAHAATADADGRRLPKRDNQLSEPQTRLPAWQDPDGRSGAVAWGAYEPAIRRWERALGRRAPAPTETSRRGSQRLSPVFVEWMQGLALGHVTAVPGLSRNAQLKALGNGVVPQQAYAALSLMAGRLEQVAS